MKITRMTRMTRTTWTTTALVAVALSMPMGCSSDDESADDTTTTAAETTTTTTATAPAQDVLVYPTDHTAGLTLDKTEVTTGDVVTVSVTGFDPDVSLSSAFLGKWPPTEMPDAAHMVTLKADAATTDADGAATIEVTIDPVCAQGDCYLVVADGIGPEGIYAGMKLNYIG